MFPNNRFSEDTHEEHYQRVMLCAQGVATYNVELAFRPSWVTDITAYPPEFEALLNAQNLEDADWHGAIAALETARNSLYEFNSSARWMVKTILDDPTMDSGDLRMIDDAFDIDEELTKGYMNLTENTRKLLHGQERLVDIGAPWTLPADMVTNLTNGLASVVSLAQTAEDEHGEKLKATDDVYTKRTIGENLLRNIFRWVVANWDDDDPRMLEFGFVPKSQIHTPGEPPVELPDWPGPMKKYSVIEVQPGTVQIDYSGVKEATKAVIERRLVGTDEWILVGEVPMAPEEILPFREMHVPPGMWEYRTTPYRDDEPGMPSIATVEVTE